MASNIGISIEEIHEAESGPITDHWSEMLALLVKPMGSGKYGKNDTV